MNTDASEVPGVSGGPSAPQEAGASGQSPVPDVDSADIGYRGPTACSAAGITYRQLDYWARTGLVEPTDGRLLFASELKSLLLSPEV